MLNWRGNTLTVRVTIMPNKGRAHWPYPTYQDERWPQLTHGSFYLVFQTFTVEFLVTYLRFIWFICAFLWLLISFMVFNRHSARVKNLNWLDYIDELTANRSSQRQRMLVNKGSQGWSLVSCPQGPVTSHTSSPLTLEWPNNFVVFGSKNV